MVLHSIPLRLFSVLLSLKIVLIIYLVSVNDSYLSSGLASLGVLLFLLFFNEALVTFRIHLSKNNQIVPLAIVCLLGLAGSVLNNFLLASVVTFGSIGFYLYLRDIQINKRNISLLFFLSSAFAIGFTQQYWHGTGSPFLLDGIATRQTNGDLIFFASLISNIQTYGVSTTGVAGLESFAYHHGAFWVFAQICSLIGTRPFSFLDVTYPCVFFPLLLHSFFQFGKFYSGQQNYSSRQFLVAALLAYMLFFSPLPFSVISDLHPGIGWVRLLRSPSYLVAVWLSLQLAILWITRLKASTLSYKDLILGTILLAFITYCKVTVGIVWLALCFAYLFFTRKPLFASKIHIATFLTVPTLFVFYLSLFQTDTQFGWLDFYRRFVPPQWHLLYFPYYYAPFITLLVFQWYRKQQLPQNRLIKIAPRIFQERLCALGLIFVTSIPNVFIAEPNGNISYLTSMPRWVCLAILCATCCQIRVSKQQTWIVTGIILLLSTQRAFDFFSQLPKLNATATTQPKQRKLSPLLKLAKLPVSKRRKSSVWVDWNLSFRRQLALCHITSVIPSALSGMVSLPVGLIPGCPTNTHGYHQLKKFLPTPSYNPTHQQLCLQGKRFGFSQIYRVTGQKTLRIDCVSSSVDSIS